MPRLSTETREQRRRHVLVSAWRCFARDGFHATSMDDVIAATGMSSSAVYRYFRSKEELVAAASQESLAQLRELFDRLLAQQPAPTPAATITALVGQLTQRSEHADYDLSKIAIHAWAESLRRPELAASTRDSTATCVGCSSSSPGGGSRPGSSRPTPTRRRWPRCCSRSCRA